MFPRRNNLEWLRLFFAVQVVLHHSASYIGAPMPAWLEALPGVPAFFFVSGFLIYASYLNAPDSYVRNRFLRLFPGLFLVATGGFGVAIIAKGAADVLANPGLYAGWFVSQITLGQAFNPGQFRDIGVGVINGALWTITVEILFYCAVPVIVWLERNLTRYAVVLLTILSFAIYAVAPAIPFHLADKPLYEYLALTPIVWGWMFGCGILAAQNWKRIEPLLPYLPLAVVPFIAMAVWGDGLLFSPSGGRMGLLYFACYVCLIVFAAFGLPARPIRTDISYGTYVWHMPVINLLIVLGLPYPLLAIGLTLLIALASWFLVEKPALALKRRSLKPVEGD